MLRISPLLLQNIPLIVDSFAAVGWPKPEQQYKDYYKQQENGQRTILCAWLKDKFAGYVTVLWSPTFEPFRQRHIPEISDLNVLPDFRGQKVASRLMDEAEKICLERHPVIGIGVGLSSNYGNAQRLYIKRGYIPLGNGLFYNEDPVQKNGPTIVDDNLVLYLTKPEIKI